MAFERLTSEEMDHLLAAEQDLEAFFTVTSDAPLLRLLASIDRDLLATLMDEQHYEPGEIVFLEGDSGNAMFLIWAGRAVVVKGDFDAPTILGYRGPGEIVGEMALLEGAPRSASVVAVDYLRLLRIDRDNFNTLLSSTSAIGMSIMASLSARLRASDTMRTIDAQTGRQLLQQVSSLKTENKHLLELQRIRQETSDLVVHDLRNPLGIIMGVLNMLDMVLPPDVLETNRELLGIASNACERMQRLVDSLLDVSRLETGEFQLALTLTDVRALLQEAMQRISLGLEMAGVTGVVEVPDDLPPVMMDADKIDRVVANLLDNAVKYTPNGGAITLDAWVEDESIVIRVTDTGPGIPSQDRKRIFERFAQVSSDRPKRRGFGLGLTFCYLAVQAHGGRIWVEPGPNDTGSRFVFTIPLRGPSNNGAH